MHEYLRRLMQPLTLALLATWSAVGLSLRGLAPETLAWSWVMMILFLLAALLCDAPGASRHSWRGPRRAVHLLVAIEVAAVLGLVWLAGRYGTTPVLLVVLAAQLSLMWPLRRTIAAVLLMNAALYLLLVLVEHGAPLLLVLLYSGFQAFALLLGHYARTAEQARDRLALVNADLLATRALLADSARDAERLRMARDLHDVAGHKLTAMTISLRELAADPAMSSRDEVRLAQQLAQELLGDIRGVVHALRDARGLDLETALRALAAAMPRPELHLQVDPEVRVTDPMQAEALLRLVQESLTNAARHSGAQRLLVRLRRQDDELHVHIEDDGRLQGRLCEGSGIAGMRERVAALHGSLALGRTPRGGLCIDASLPA